MFRPLLCVALCLCFVPAAFAHARLLRSTPARDTVVAVAPVEIELWFNELLDESFNTVAVFPAAELTNQQRRSLTAAKPLVDASDRTHLRVKLGPLAPGEYVVEWRVLSRDGHSAPGRFMFSVVAR